jgi:hypothetical protein
MDFLAFKWGCFFSKNGMFFPQKWFRMDSYFSLENEWFLKP